MRFITLLQEFGMRPAFKAMKKKAAEKARDKEDPDRNTIHGNGENG